METIAKIIIIAIFIFITIALSFLLYKQKIKIDKSKHKIYFFSLLSGLILIFGALSIYAFFW